MPKRGSPEVVAMALTAVVLGCSEGRDLVVSDAGTETNADTDEDEARSDNLGDGPGSDDLGDGAGGDDSRNDDSGGDDAGSDDTGAGDACRDAGICDCWCHGGGTTMAGACCEGDQAGSIDYWTVRGPDGCPRCACGFVPRRTCELGCFDGSSPDGPPGYLSTALCGEEILAACGNGSIDPGEECEPEPPEECTVRGCPAPGHRTTCTSNCREVEWPECRLPVEICGNGIDDDCDGATEEGCAPECCTDLLDDNGDGSTDCNDPTCAGDPACVPCRTGQEMCGDGCDNDGDCRTDAADEDCIPTPGSCTHLGCVPGAESCGNECDDDRDGRVDCADADCADAADCLYCSGDPAAEMFACGDGRDNDCDGMTDGCDPGCDWVRTVERCANRVDDDGDGQRDCADTDCFCDVRCLAIMPEDCADGMDNDADTLIDGDDWDCPRPCG
ncbi:MAG: hypothetical protein HY905_21820 [Deltaproteobacteria bacterium]|nr:hypothetical protein [Deltaproteobacteria bacterium]